MLTRELAVDDRRAGTRYVGAMRGELYAFRSSCGSDRVELTEGRLSFDFRGLEEVISVEEREARPKPRCQLMDWTGWG